MKKQLSLPLLFSALLFAACSSNTTPDQVSVPVDSVNLKDSLAKVEIKRSDENKVIGDIEFGITKTEFDRKLKKFLASSKKNKYETGFFIGEYSYSGVDKEIDSSKLYSVTLNGNYIHYDDYKSKLVYQVEFLKTMLMKKYGEPSIQKGAPAWHETEKNYSYLAYSWDIGSKKIEVRVSNREIYYTADLKIYQPKVEDMVEQRVLNNSLSTANSAKDVL